MGCVGDYEVIEESFSKPDYPFEITVTAPEGKKVLGGGIRFGSVDLNRLLTYTGRPSADGTSWTFRVVTNSGGGIAYAPYTGVAAVTVARMGD